MTMSFNDDDPIVLPPGPKPIVGGRIQIDLRTNPTAPCEENIQKVILEITGMEQSRSGLDLVVVLDVSDGMRGDKLQKMKTAIIFVIKKLTLIDRLSIIKYSSCAERLCSLRLMTVNYQRELKNLIKDLEPLGPANMTHGLEMALNVLKDRSISNGRVGAIMLMSHGGQNSGGDAAAVQLGNVQMHTFGFGDDHDAKVLKAIAGNSWLGGTYSDVHLDNLSLAFSQCLGGLLSVVAQNLTVKFTQIEGTSMIKPPVTAGSYEPSMNYAADSVTINFGDICIHEVRRVLVELLLLPVVGEQATDVLRVCGTYSFDGQTDDYPPMYFCVNRLLDLTAEEQQTPPEVRAEELRVHIAEVIKQATADADKNNLTSAQHKLAYGLETLGDLRTEDSYKLKDMLRAELEELRELMKTQTIYEKKGRPFAYSSLISHATQRQTARGNNINKFMFFSTPTMREFHEEAMKFSLRMTRALNLTHQILQWAETEEEIDSPLFQFGSNKYVFKALDGENGENFKSIRNFYKKLWASK